MGLVSLLDIAGSTVAKFSKAAGLLEVVFIVKLPIHIAQNHVW